MSKASTNDILLFAKGLVEQQSEEDFPVMYESKVGTVNEEELSALKKLISVEVLDDDTELSLETMIDTDSGFVTEGSVGYQAIEINLPKVNAEKINIDSIKDSSGILGKEVGELLESWGVGMLPLKVTRVMKKCTSLVGHEIVSFGETRYASSIKVRENKIQEYSDRIVNSLTKGLAFKANLEKIVENNNNGERVKCFDLSLSEIATIVSMFEEYKVRTLYSKDKDIFTITVGDSFG